MHHTDMKRTSLLILIAVIISSLWGCAGLQTRVEHDIYTISERDTTTLWEAQNAPGNRDNGVIYPSSRTFKSERLLIQRDSLVDRFYPDFIRLGAFESIGLLGTGEDEYGIGTGLFGIFPDFKNVSQYYRGEPGKLFKGGLYRIGVGEWRLRWFRDSPDWTIGTSLAEIIAPDARLEKTLTSVLPLYIRKRYFLKETIPYVALTGAFGIGYYPSQYVNLSASLDAGSLGGLNLRLYAGIAAGITSKSSMKLVTETFYRNIENTEVPHEGQTSVIPYIGLGISVLDFFNLVPETQREWKDHEHSSWNVGLIQMGAVLGGSQESFYEQDSEIKGMIARIANASIAIPILNNQFYAGTSLLNVVVLGKNEWGIGVLPIRLGYWQTVLQDELSTEPFVEYNYYPSSFFHIGNRLNLRISESLNIGIIMGYASGTSGDVFGSDLIDGDFEFGVPGEIGNWYIGISVGFWDRIFFPEHLRYNRNFED